MDRPEPRKNRQDMTLMILCNRRNILEANIQLAVDDLRPIFIAYGLVVLVFEEWVVSL